MLNVNIAKLDIDAVIPSQNVGDVGFDIRSLHDVHLRPNSVTKVSTGIAIAGYEYELKTEQGLSQILFPKIEGRSGLASQGIFPVGGIIDPSYRGELIVALANINDTEVFFKRNDRIAQLVFYTCMASPGLSLQLTDVSNVSQTSRGSKGFGSSGK
jgi:deoxyuridine 5'-triphosphate nucleotidohydrolase